MKKTILTLGICLLAGCAEQSAPNVDNDKLANEIAQATLITDTHIDVPYRLENKWANVSMLTNSGEFDYVRAKKGGLNAPFMSIYTPASLGVTQAALQHAEDAIAIVERIERETPDKFTIAHSTADVEAAFKAGKIALPMGMENGSPILNDITNLDYFHKRGIRYITLAHSKWNQISDSSYDSERKWDGLSEFGFDVVRRMNKLGIMVDISHVSDAAFYDVMETTMVPVIASHSSARHFTPGWERNMSDEMIKALAENGGVIMISFGSMFINQEASAYSPKLEKAYEAHLADAGLEDTDERRFAFAETYRQEHPYPFATLDQVLDHFDHVVKLVGVDYVGIGSDYDGVGDALPIGLKDVSGYPNLVKGLLDRGYSRTDIEKILSGNLMRVWRAVEAYAEKQHTNQ